MMRFFPLFSEEDQGMVEFDDGDFDEPMEEDMEVKSSTHRTVKEELHQQEDVKKMNPKTNM